MEKKLSIKFTVLAVFSIIIFAFAVSPVQLQNDTFYTIKIGEYIMQNGVTTEEPFAWHEGLNYTFPHWAYDVFIYLIYDIGGMTGIYLSTVMLAAILGICIYFVNTKLNKNQLLSFFMALAVMYLIKDFIAARAQLVTFILFLLAVFFMEKFYETKKKRYGVALVIIPIIIANVHSAVFPFYFILLMPYIGEYLISLLANSDLFIIKQKIKKQSKKIELEEQKENKKEEDIIKLKEKLSEYEQKLEKIQKRKENKNSYKIILEKNSAGKWLIVIAIICAFSGLLTPIGDMPYTYLTRIAEGNTTQSISEHLPLTLAKDENFASLLAVAIILLMFTDAKMKLRDWFMLGGLIVLAFISRRQESMVYLIGTIMLGKVISYLMDKYDPKGTETVMKFMVSLCGKIITISLVLAVTLVLVKPKMSEQFISERNYPVKLADYMLENLDVENIRIFNEYNYGSYLLYRGIPVFIDSRSDLYTPQFNDGIDIFSDFMSITNLNSDYNAKFEKYGITHVVLYKNAKLNLLLKKDSNYNLLYSDDSLCLYERINA